jgi:hypothetical protein
MLDFSIGCLLNIVLLRFIYDIANKVKTTGKEKFWKVLNLHKIKVVIISNGTEVFRTDVPKKLNLAFGPRKEGSAALSSISN